MTFLVRAEEPTGVTGGTRRARRREHPTVALERAILAILSEGPSHGYVILSKLERRLGGVCGISYGQVYRVLAGLERRGLIIGRSVQVARRPPRREYELSDTGRASVRRWLTEAPRPTMFFGTDFYLRLPFLWALDGRTRDEVLGQQVRPLPGVALDRPRERGAATRPRGGDPARPGRPRDAGALSRRAPARLRRSVARVTIGRADISAPAEISAPASPPMGEIASPRCRNDSCTPDRDATDGRKEMQ